MIEEKRSFVEAQIRDALYHLPADQRPEVAGKTLPNGEALLSPLLELSPEAVGTALGMPSPSTRPSKTCLDAPATLRR